MKRIIAIVAAVLLLFSLPGCASKADKKDSAQPEQIDAASISQTITTPQYTLMNIQYSEPLWLKDGLSGQGDVIYYLGYNDQSACLCSFNWRDNQRRELYQSDSEDIQSFALSSDGIFLLTADRETEQYEIAELDLNGEELRRFDLGSVSSDGEAIKEIAFAHDMLFTLSNSHLRAYLTGDQIKEGCSREVSPNACLSKSAEGELFLGQTENGTYHLYQFDEKKRGWDVLASFNMDYCRISCGDSWDFYLDDTHALYGYSAEEKKLEKLFAWNALGLISGKIIELPDGSLASSARMDPEGNGPLVFLEKREERQLETSVIRLATTGEYLDYRIQEAIREWNTENPDHPIEVVRYSVFDDGSDPRAARMRLAADIAAGKIPDIYDFSMVSIDTIPSSGQFARRGLLEDLYPYIDKDPELSREDFFSGVLRSLEISGGLYELVPEYSLTTSFAYSGAVGEASSWTYANFNDVVSQSPYVETLFDNHYGRAFWLGNVIAASGEQLVNWETGECYFDSDYFKNVLETAKRVPEEGLPHAYSTLNTDVQNSTSLLYYCNIGDIWMASIAPSAFGENYCFVGFPEIGNVIYPSLSFGISSFSANKEECWAFLRQFVTREYNTQFFLSPRRYGMQGQIDRAWKEVVEDGNDRIHPYGLEAMNEIAAIIENASLAARHDPQIWQIVWPEASAYFAGQRSLEDTVDLIQSRASIYMAEQS